MKNLPSGTPEGHQTFPRGCAPCPMTLGNSQGQTFPDIHCRLSTVNTRPCLNINISMVLRPYILGVTRGEREVLCMACLVQTPFKCWVSSNLSYTCSVPRFGIHWKIAKRWPNDDQLCCFKKTKRWPFEDFKDDQFQVLRCLIKEISGFETFNVPEWQTVPISRDLPPTGWLFFSGPPLICLSPRPIINFWT